MFRPCRARSIPWRLVAFIVAMNGVAAMATESEWVEDQVLLYLETPDDTTAVVSACSGVAGLGWRFLASDIAALTLSPGSDVEQAAAQVMALQQEGITAASPHYLYAQSDESDVGALSLDEYEIPDYLHFSCPGVNDPLLDQQWGLGRDFLNIAPVWGQTLGDSNTVVVLIDGGLDITHPDLDPTSRSFRGYSTLDPATSSETWMEDYSGHGTAMAGIIWAQHNNQYGMAGVAPAAALRFIKAGYRPAPNYKYVFELLALLDAIELVRSWAINEVNHNFIVSCSLAYGHNTLGYEAQRIREAMQGLLALHNVLVVAAVGNDNDYSLEEVIPGSIYDEKRVIGYCAIPAAFSGVGKYSDPYYSADLDNIVLAVGGITAYASDGNWPVGCTPAPTIDIGPPYRTSYASYTDTCEIVVDVAAPGGGSFDYRNSSYGVQVLSASPLQLTPTGFAYGCGNSYSTAYIAGIAALAWSKNPGLTAEQLKYIMRVHAKRYRICPPELLGQSGGGVSPGRISLCPFIKFLGIHRFHGFVNGYESRCPFPSAALEEPVVWPQGSGQKTTNLSFDFDSVSSLTVGSGIPDAAELYAAIEERNVYKIAGGTLEGSVVCENADAVSIYGDLTIAQGATLHIIPRDPSRTFRVVFNDYDRIGGGSDTTRVEIRIAGGGTFNIDAGQVDFRPYKFASSTDSCWSGLTIESGANFLTEASVRKVSLSGCLRGLTAAAFPAQIESLSIASAGRALSVNGDMSVRQLTAKGAGDVVRIEPMSRLELTGPGFSDIRHIHSGSYDFVGVNMKSHSTLVISGGGCLIDGDGHGVGLALLSPSVRICGGSSGGLVVQDCNYGLLGQYCHGALLEGTVRVEGSRCDGFYLEQADSVSFVSTPTECWIGDNLQNGLRLENCRVLTLSGLTIENNGGAGMNALGQSSVKVRGCEFRYNGTGVLIADDSVGDLGDLEVGDPGENCFVQNGVYNVSNLNQAALLPADGNLWWRRYAGLTCPPEATKIYGRVRTTCP